MEKSGSRKRGRAIVKKYFGCSIAEPIIIKDALDLSTVVDFMDWYFTFNRFGDSIARTYFGKVFSHGFKFSIRGKPI